MILQIRDGFLAALLCAVAALAISSPAVAAPKDVRPSCAPPEEAPAKSNAATPKAADHGASAKGKSNAADASDDDDDDAKDFPPLKKGESFHLIGFSLSGSKHIDGDALTATLPEQVGDPISLTQIKADTDKIKKALTERHVHFSEVTASTLQRSGPDHCIWVIWDIQHIDAFSQIPYQGYWKFGRQTFSGNKALTNEQLEKAIDLKPDERVREGAISDAITGMQQAYDKIFPGKTVKIKGKLKLTLKPARVADFEWQIVEPPAK